MKQWYVLQTLFGQEKRAEAHLVNQNVECWFPFTPAVGWRTGRLPP